MLFARFVFLIAGVCGIVIMAPMYFLENRLGIDYLPAITHPEIFYGFIGVTLAWQFMFLVIAADPVRFRLAMLPAILEKLSYVIAIIALVALGRAQGMVVGFAALDALWAILFTVSFIRTRRVDPPRS